MLFFHFQSVKLISVKLNIYIYNTKKLIITYLLENDLSYKI